MPVLRSNQSDQQNQIRHQIVTELRLRPVPMLITLFMLMTNIVIPDMNELYVQISA